MNFRFVRLLLLLCTVVLSGCTLFEPGGPSAAITVKGHSRSQVQDVVERVFVDAGYKPYTRMLEGVMFEKEASKSDRLLYGDWGDGQVTQRVKVTISPDREDHFRVRCMSFVAREAHDVSFEDQHRRMQISSPYLNRLLREVRSQCDELWLSRDPMAADFSN